MSIKTGGLIEAGPFKVTASVSAGFVKNDASGNLLFGQLASAWELLDFQATPGGSPDTAFTGLNGDVDEVYQIIWQAIGNSSSGSSRGELEINGALPASSAVTRTVGTETNSAFQGPVSNLNWTLWRENAAFSSAGIAGRCIIYAKSGKIRTGESWASGQRPITAQPSRAFEGHYSQRWNDTTTNITSLNIGGSFSKITFKWLYKLKIT